MKSIRILYLFWIFIHLKCFQANNVTEQEEKFDLGLHEENSKLHMNILKLFSKNLKIREDNSNCWRSLNNAVNDNEAWNSNCIKFSEQLVTVMNDMKRVMTTIEPIIDEFNRGFRKSCYRTEMPTTCNEASAARINGIYMLQLPYSKQAPFSVACDFDPDSDNDDGWIVMQRRFDGSVDFYRPWLDYKEGFGNLDGEHFLGLKYLHLLTAHQPHELLIELQDFENVTKYARYEHFVLDNENNGYRIKELSGYSGNAGTAFSDGLSQGFSTFDKGTHTRCALKQQGAWWFNYCDYCNLNGPFYAEEHEGKDSIFWWGFYGSSYTKLKSVKLMIRPELN